ncbi:CBS domain-containing protein [uncultured Halopseudomonas sp.]|uniref:CBS domain-containing protein n=1 Tax=uncultured Halopseudomonas sp. TaxID=2901193 RepID=UPI0030EC496F|tara:strand:+ start:7549 stop:7965 length:417 start_codon:yes stop_codon:yes gene_type:complete
MLKIVKVHQYMTADLVCFTPETDLAKAIDQLLQHRISGAPVINERKQLVGILSEGDCLKGALTGSYFEEAAVKVSDVMSLSVDTVDVDADIVTVAERFVQSGRRRFPVVDGGKLVGQISRRDILRAVKQFNDNGAPKA